MIPLLVDGKDKSSDVVDSLALDMPPGDAGFWLVVVAEGEAVAALKSFKSAVSMMVDFAMGNVDDLLTTASPRREGKHRRNT